MREAAGLTLRTTASEIGCSHQHLARVESGERALTRDLADRIAQAIAEQLRSAVA
jgi:transcriptional regulator with XRE-family HTH domain